MIADTIESMNRNIEFSTVFLENAVPGIEQLFTTRQQYICFRTAVYNKTTIYLFNHHCLFHFFKVRAFSILRSTFTEIGGCIELYFTYFMPLVKREKDFLMVGSPRGHR